MLGKTIREWQTEKFKKSAIAIILLVHNCNVSDTIDGHISIYLNLFLTRV